MSKKRKWHLPANDASVTPEDGDARILGLDGDWSIPTSMEELLQEVGLSFEEQYDYDYS